jgi:AbrB family looped-hinge helix DNA binding protein
VAAAAMRSPNNGSSTSQPDCYDEFVTHATLSVNEQGRVTIPAQMRQELGLQAGASVVAYIEDGRLILEDRAHLAARIQREATETRTGTGSVVDDLIAERRAAAAREADER